MRNGTFRTIKVTNHRWLGRTKQYEVEWSGPSTMWDKVYKPTWVNGSLLTGSKKHIEEYNASFDSPGNNSLSKATALLLCLTNERKKRNILKGQDMSIVNPSEIKSTVVQRMKNAKEYD